MSNNTNGILSSVLSWGKILGFIIIIILSLIILKYAICIISASIRRHITVNKIKTAAAQSGFEIELHDGAYNVISSNSKKYEMILRNGQKTLNVKLLSCLRSRGRYTLVGLEKLIEVKSFAPLLWAPAGFMYYKSVKGAVNPKFSSAPVEKSREYTIDPEFPEPDINNINIICFTPPAHEITRTEGNRTVIVSNGDQHEGCLLFSGDGLVKYIENIG